MGFLNDHQPLRCISTLIRAKITANVINYLVTQLINSVVTARLAKFATPLSLTFPLFLFPLFFFPTRKKPVHEFHEATSSTAGVWSLVSLVNSCFHDRPLRNWLGFYLSFVYTLAPCKNRGDLLFQLNLYFSKSIGVIIRDTQHLRILVWDRGPKNESTVSLVTNVSDLPWSFVTGLIESVILQLESDCTWSETILYNQLGSLYLELVLSHHSRHNFGVKAPSADQINASRYN